MSRTRFFVEDKVYLGIDVGSVSSKIVALAKENQAAILKKIKAREELFALNSYSSTIRAVENLFILSSNYTRTQGDSAKVTLKLLQRFLIDLPPELIGGIRITGSGAGLISQLLNIPPENDFRSLATGVGVLHPEVAAIFEMGGESSKYIAISTQEESGEISILDYGKNGDCAAGTGVFMDQQASRLLYRIEDVGRLVCQTKTAATIAGRCSVFAKSDMIHAQQKGFQPPDILKGLCEAVIRNFKGTIVKGKALGKKVAFVGGVAANQGAVNAVRDIFDLSEEQLVVPELPAYLAAIGAALLASQSDGAVTSMNLFPLPVIPETTIRKFPRTQPLSLAQVTLLRNQTQQIDVARIKQPVKAWLGIDIGSVSTKLAVIDEQGNLIKEIYTRTDARPIEVITRGLKEIGEEIGSQVKILGVGTTGSGRELIGQLVGADTIKDEITAHKTGAMYVSETMLHRQVDTIFDIGGQDSKYISIENGVVVDFTMNEACAAGTGSFLEEQAERLGINIIQEFSNLALAAKHPIRLGERCTVFMEKVLSPYLQQGARKDDLVAGLAYSIVTNYLNRVVRGRKIGDVIYFQGGTAYNDAVAAAFATTLNKEVIVPPYNGVLGAIGAALIARQRMEQASQPSRFRGFFLEKMDYQLRNFTCKGCSNFCDIQEFTVAGEKSYWGDKCSDRYRKARKQSRTPVIPNLIRAREELLEPFLQTRKSGTKIGIPRSMYFFDQLPFWSTYLNELGFQLVFSEKTNKSIINHGVAATVAEPCFPIVVAHGHIQDLIDKKVDYIFQPNVVNQETQFPEVESFLCPWGQTQPFVFKHVPAFQSYWPRIIFPTIRFREGALPVKSALRGAFKKFGIKSKKSDLAVDKAFQAQLKFNQALQKIGTEALQQVQAANSMAIILVGRPYNIYDSSVSLNIPSKLRDYYGINVIPIDFLPIHDIPISEINDSMFWSYGTKILQAAKYSSEIKNLHLIYITNFKCGPDSYVKHYAHDAAKKPLLILQFDGHSNDAGIMTRCEAYLDSKGFL